MNHFKKRLEEQTPISSAQKQRVKRRVLSQKEKKRNTGLLPIVASFMFVFVVIVGSYMLLNTNSLQIETGTAPPIEFTTIYDVMVRDGESVSAAGMDQWNSELYYYDDRKHIFQKRHFNVYTTLVTDSDRLEIGDLVGVLDDKQKVPMIGNIIATPNDRVKIENGKLYINDKLFEQYYFAGMNRNGFEEKGGKLLEVKLTEQLEVDTFDYVIASYDWINAPILMAKEAKEVYKVEHVQRSSTDEQEQMASYLETGDEQYLIGVSPEMVLKTYLFTESDDHNTVPTVKALALKEFSIVWPYDLAYHEEKFEEMLSHVPASIYQGTASMHIKGWDIPFVTVEFQKINDVWKISKIE
ncbi:S26 family signal peptidase [Lysinibacillus sp. LZ02]|uniref:S26 family signal peptidase n=1 Tax=Lysinibacillus sp. LZ02 TaxID=3420668 RepID=UPI003D360293